MECAEEGVPNGRLLALQIKAGASYFEHQDDTGFVFRGELRHLDYWLDHSLPVVLVLYNPEEKRAYWAAVTEDAVQHTPRAWKITVPRDQVLNSGAAPALQQLAADDAYVLRLNGLRSHRTWMQLLSNGGSVVVVAEEWVNNTSGRGTIQLIGTPPGGRESLERDWMIFAGLRPYSEVLPELFPWGELRIDDQTYEEADEELWTEEVGIWDSEDKRYIGHAQDFEEWRTERLGEGIRPYRNEMGEVDRWRLRVDLNALGRSFLQVNAFLEGPREDG